MPPADGKILRQVKVLLIEDDSGYAQIVRTRLETENIAHFEIRCAASLAEAFELKPVFVPDAILTDLGLPDSKGLDTFRKVAASWPDVPVAIFSAMNDEEAAMEAVRAGAQDYMVKGEFDGSGISRLILHGMERQRIKKGLEQLSIQDELTKLYNRRGFLALGLEHLQLAKRTGRALTLVLIDLDEFKKINDTHGHPAGDLALIRMAELLKKTFRLSDIIARIGGDEFGVITVEADENSRGVLRSRLEDAVAACNASANLPFRLSFSLGFAGLDLKKIFCIEQLVARADEALYEHKKSKKVPLTDR